MATGEVRDWIQLDSFTDEYEALLDQETWRSTYLHYLNDLAQRSFRAFSDTRKNQDSSMGRLFALRSKIFALQKKLGIAQEGDSEEHALLEIELPFLQIPHVSQLPRKKSGVHFRLVREPIPEGHLYPVTRADITQTLSCLPPEHAAVTDRIVLTNQKNQLPDGDWGWGTIRLHCLLEAIRDTEGNVTAGRRVFHRRKSYADIRRFGGRLIREGKVTYAVWDIESYKIFLLKRVLLHEIAHGVADLPGSAAQVRSVGKLEKFCEQYAENYYRPPGKSIRLF